MDGKSNMFTPYFRPRRLRGSGELRRMVRETQLTVDDLIYPLFVTHEKTPRTPIASMPGQDQLSLEEVVKQVASAQALGIPAVVLFGLPETKDAGGSDSPNDSGLIQTAVRAIKEPVSGILVSTDVSFGEYTDPGPCGLVTHG